VTFFGSAGCLHVGCLELVEDAETAVRPVAAGHPSSPGQQSVCCGVVAAALAVNGQSDQVQRSAAQPELIRTCRVAAAPGEG
jgi:hypothetical protein